MVLGLVLVFTGGAMAASVTSGVAASASVVAKCRVTGDATALAFGEYDATANVDAQGTVTFRCTKSTGWKVYITGTREMTFGANTLNFSIYSDAGRTTTYPNDATSTLTGTSTGSNADITQTYYGRVPLNQDQPVGIYSTAAALNFTVDY